ncbi:hypothetical protein ACU8V3_01555 [Cobetia marina]
MTIPRPMPSRLPQASATFSWVRLAQRIPVRVEFDDIEAVRASGVNLAAGMTASVRLLSDITDAEDSGHGTP